jgi:predicted acyltransferase
VKAPPPSPPQRYLALDALRGLAILGMALSEFVPLQLPPWMYHWQNQGPNHDTNIQIFGISWVDLVFPVFLFSMGASIPLALQRRFDKGATTRDIVLGILLRGVLLAVFALAGQHLRPLVLFSEPSFAAWALGLLGFGFLVLMFARWPDKIPPKTGRILTWLGWIGAFLLIITHPYPDKANGFANYRLDIILMVLANMAVAGGLIWLFTRNRPIVRYAITAAVMLIFMTRTLGGVGQAIWDYTPLQHFQRDHWPNLFDLQAWPYARFVPVVYHFEYIKYLLIVIPGTLCGDVLLRKPDLKITAGWHAWRYGWGCLIGVAIASVACAGLMLREIVATTLILTVLSLTALYLFRAPRSTLEKKLQTFAQFGTSFVIFGLLAEPLEGGIRKASPTASYYLLTTGIAFFLLISFTVAIEVFQKAKWMKTTIELGQNPMLGYIAATNLIPAIFGLAMVDALATKYMNNQWALTGIAIVETAAVAYATALFTRFRIFLRT